MDSSLKRIMRCGKIKDVEPASVKIETMTVRQQV